jgi:hypothetical protein
MRAWKTTIGIASVIVTGCATQRAPPLTLAALAADSTARKIEISKLQGLLGTWRGPGWRVLPTGERVEYDQTVVVTSKMAGQALTIEGNSVRRPQVGPPGSGSFAVITWEPNQSHYAFRSFTGGRLTYSDGQLLSPDTFMWRVKGPPLALRFTVVLDGTTWREIGEVSRDGEQTWVQTYALEMVKQTAP